MRRLLTAAALVLAACDAPEEAAPPPDLEEANVAATLAALVALDAETFNAADLYGNVGNWGVGVWTSERGVRFALQRRANDDMKWLRLQCETGGISAWVVNTARPLTGWPDSGVSKGNVWISGNNGPETRMDLFVHTSGGVVRGFVVAMGSGGDWPEIASLPRTMSFRPEGEAAVTFDLAGIEDAYRLAHTVTGLCPPAGS